MSESEREMHKILKTISEMFLKRLQLMTRSEDSTLTLLLITRFGDEWIEAYPFYKRDTE